MLDPSASARKDRTRQIRVCADSKANGNGGRRDVAGPARVSLPVCPCACDRRRAPAGAIAAAAGTYGYGYRCVTEDPSTLPSMMSRAYCTPILWASI